MDGYGDPIVLKTEEFWEPKTESRWTREIKGWPCLQCGVLVTNLNMHNTWHLEDAVMRDTLSP